MSVTKTRIEKNLQAIREKIAEACLRSGRRIEEVGLVAVTKSVDVETIRNAIDAGLTELGESRAQELVSRAAEIDAFLRRRRTPDPPAVRWHMVGHLQRNKVRSVLGAASVIHSIDSLRLAEETNARALRAERVADVFLQVNCSEEAQKFGVAVGAAVHLGEMIGTMAGLRLVGLMTMAPLTDAPELARSSFRRLRELFEEMSGEKIGGSHFQHLSMGMSHDYGVAVEEGATLLRIGAALFE